MKEIKMVDLKSQYQNIKSEIDSSIQSVIDSTSFINGDAVHRFQLQLEQYLGIKHVIPCANGTDALQIALMSLNLEPGDEVITPDFTFISTVEVVALIGLTPVLVDVDPDTFCITAKAIEKAISPRTKAIVPVHLFGQCCNMDAMNTIAKKYNLQVIEDVAQAFGAEYILNNGETVKAGTLGNIGCTSFFPSKNLGCFGDGGAIFTDNDELAEKMRSIANHGMKVKYYHDTIGVNSRLDSIQAAILSVKLKYLNQYNEARKNAASHYDRRFANHPRIKTPFKSPTSTHIYHQYTIIVNEVNRDSLIEYMKKMEIPVMVYYPVPMHLQKAYCDSRYKEGDFPVTERLCKEVISLPMHSELDDEQLAYICNNLLDFINKQKN